MFFPHDGFQPGYRSAVCYLFLGYGLMNSPLSAGKIASTEEGTNMMDGDFTDLDFDEFIRTRAALAYPATYAANQD